MKLLRTIFTRKQPIYTARIFEVRTWLDEAVTEALRIQELDLNLTTNPNLKDQ